jgi:hypothetical protein
VVNTATSGVQNYVSSARLANGNVVATWRTDLGGGDIRAQILSPAGAVIGSEFAVNTLTAGNQTINTVAALPGGGFVIAWATDFFQIADQRGRIEGQIFSAAGARTGGEFNFEEVNPVSINRPEELSIAAHPDGSFALSSFYASRSTQPGFDSSTTIFTRPISAQGAVGVGVQVATGPTASATPFVIGLLDSVSLTTGNFIVSYTLDMGQGPRVSSRVFQPPAQPLSAASPVSNEAAFEHSLAALPNGGFIIARRVAPQTLKVSQFDAAGAAVGSDIVIGTGAASSLGVLTDGRIAVAFEGPGAAGGGDRDIYAATFTLAGTVSAITLVNQATAGNQTAPRLEATSGGGFIVLWNDGGTGDVKGRVFTG